MFYPTGSGVELEKPERTGQGASRQEDAADQERWTLSRGCHVVRRNFCHEAVMR
jgi:hypothetical protein